MEKIKANKKIVGISVIGLLGLGYIAYNVGVEIGHWLVIILRN